MPGENSLATPEHDKVAAVREKSQAIGEFLEWLGERGLVIAEWAPESHFEDRLVTAPGSIQSRLAEYFEIDEDKLEEEKRAMLDAIRARGAA